MSTQEPTSPVELVVVTGASTGIGAATARELARRGFHVLAGVRRESDANALRSERIEPHLLDITNEGNIAAITERVTRDPEGRPLRALVNNAGIAVNAPVEALPIDEWRRQFEVNLFGHIAMTQAQLPALLASSGAVVNISSVGGRVAMATYGAYAGSKFALEAVSDALRREVAPFGVKVIVIEPGAVSTEMSHRGVATAERLAAAMTTDQHQRYDALIGAITTQARTFASGGVPAAHAAGVVADAITSPNPRTRYTIGRDAAIIVRLARLASDRLLDRMLARNLKPHYKQAEIVPDRSGLTASRKRLRSSARSPRWSSERNRKAVVAVNAVGAGAAATFAATGLARPGYVQSGSSSSSLTAFWAASSAARTWAISAPLLAGIIRGGRPVPELLTVAGLVQLGDAALGVWQRNAGMAVFPAAMGLVHLGSARLLSR